MTTWFEAVELILAGVGCIATGIAIVSFYNFAFRAPYEQDEQDKDA